jgi:hypothetical protein
MDQHMPHGLTSGWINEQMDKWGSKGRSRPLVSRDRTFAYTLLGKLFGPHLLIKKKPEEEVVGFMSCGANLRLAV